MPGLGPNGYALARAETGLPACETAATRLDGSVRESKSDHGELDDMHIPQYLRPVLMHRAKTMCHGYANCYDAAF